MRSISALAHFVLQLLRVINNLLTHINKLSLTYNRIKGFYILTLPVHLSCFWVTLARVHRSSVIVHSRCAVACATWLWHRLSTILFSGAPLGDLDPMEVRIEREKGEHPSHPSHCGVTCGVSLTLTLHIYSPIALFCPLCIHLCALPTVKRTFPCVPYRGR